MRTSQERNSEAFHGTARREESEAAKGYSSPDSLVRHGEEARQHCALTVAQVCALRGYAGIPDHVRCPTETLRLRSITQKGLN